MVSSVQRRAASWLAAGIVCYFLFFYGLTGAGLLGPDEPRYASIGREMARSGDWLTPRLWGDAWFEKPPLLYWMTAAAFRAGLSEDLAPRLPVALLSVAFLLFFWRILRREFGVKAALFSTAILATSAGWIGFSRIGATDLPLAATFSAAMLLVLPWTGNVPGRPRLAAAAALLGVAVLAKGLVPLVLAVPALWALRRHWRELLRPAPIAVFTAIAAPWYIAMTALHGSRFLYEFFLRHHLARFFTDSLQHVQPFWFYAPVLIAGLFPWSPLLALTARKALYQDPRARFLLLWVAFGFVFFSASSNKLPGYLLPLLPPTAALAGISLAQLRKPRVVALCALLLGLLPLVAAMLPGTLLLGLTHAQPGRVSWPASALFCSLAIAVWLLVSREKLRWAVLATAAATVAGVAWLASATFPLLDRTVSARVVWREVEARRDEVCVAGVNRGWRYTLNYYSVTPLPDCGAAPMRLRIEQPHGLAPHPVPSAK